MDDTVVIGHVVSVHPAQRSLRINPVGSRKAEWKDPAWLHVAMPDGIRRCKLAAVMLREFDVQVELAPTVPRDWVASMKNTKIVVPAADALPRSNTEFDLDELEGMEVLSGTARIGRVAGSVKTPAGGVLEIERTDGGSIMVPAVTEVIERIDWESGSVRIGETSPYAADDELAT